MTDKDDIRRFLDVFKELSDFEAQHRILRGWGLYDRANLPDEQVYARLGMVEGNKRGESGMTDIGVLIDSAEKRADLPEHDPRVRCPDHPRAEVLDGFGLAGGGFGVYTYCGECGRVLTKSETEE